jgi:uncharacterized membrane protein YebE (DUF533 family)
MSEENPFVSVIRVWAALAWSDGVLAEEEAAAMRRLITSAALTDAERLDALAFLAAPVEPELARLDGLSGPAREAIYQAAVRLAALDLDIAEEERSFLKRLRQGLGLDPAAAKAIEDGILPAD